MSDPAWRALAAAGGDAAAPNRLDVLMGRSAGGFARDRRYGAPSPTPAAALEPDMPDPIATAHAAGYAEGLAQARAEGAVARAADLAAQGQLALSFARIDTELAEMLHQRLTETVVALCEASLQPLALDRAALARRARAAAAMFQRADDERVLWLHPDDLALAGDLLPGEWCFSADPALERGTIRVESAAGGAEDGPAPWCEALRAALARC